MTPCGHITVKKDDLRLGCVRPGAAYPAGDSLAQVTSLGCGNFRLVSSPGVGQHHCQRSAEVKDAKRVERVAVAAHGELVVDIIRPAKVDELAKAAQLLDVAFHLKVRFGANIV